MVSSPGDMARCQQRLNQIFLHGGHEKRVDITITQNCSRIQHKHDNAPTREVYSERSIFLGRGNALVTEICTQNHTAVRDIGGYH